MIQITSMLAHIAVVSSPCRQLQYISSVKLSKLVWGWVDTTVRICPNWIDLLTSRRYAQHLRSRCCRLSSLRFLVNTLPWVKLPCNPSVQIPITNTIITIIGLLVLLLSAYLVWTHPGNINVLLITKPELGLSINASPLVFFS